MTSARPTEVAESTGRPVLSATSGAAPIILEFRTFRGAPGLAAIRGDWNAVVGGMAHPWHFHFFTWFEAFARCLADDPDALRVVVAYAAGAPIAVFPLARGARKIGGVTVRTLEIPEHSHLSIGDFVFDSSPGKADAVAALVEHLGREPEPWDALVMRGVLENSAAWFSVTASPPRRMLTEETIVCDYFDSTQYDIRLRGFSKNFRGALRKARTKLAQQDAVEFVRAADLETLPRAFEEFVEVEGSGWKGRDGTAIGYDRRRVAFYRALLDGFGALGAAEINLLRIGGKCIAAQFCLKIDRCLYILKIGYDETWSRLAPGNMLLEHVVQRELASGGVNSVNLISDAPWHADWRPQSYRRFTAYVFNRTLPGWASYCVMFAKDRLRPFYRRYVKPVLERREPPVRP